MPDFAALVIVKETDVAGFHVVINKSKVKLCQWYRKFPCGLYNSPFLGH